MSLTINDWKSYARKSLIVLLIIAFMTTCIMPRKAEAVVPIAAAAAVEAGIGAYVLMGLVVAAGAYAFGQTEYADQAYDYSVGVWNIAQAAVKESLIASWNAAVEQGDKFMYFTPIVMDWIKDKVMGATLHSVFAYDQANVVPGGWATVTSSKDGTGSSPRGFVYRISPSDNYYFIIGGQRFSPGVATSISLYHDWDVTKTIYVWLGGTWGASQGRIGNIPLIIRPQQLDNASAFLAAYDVLIDEGYPVTVVTKTDYNELVAKESVIQSAISQGVAVPKPEDFIAYPKADKTKVATWNPDLARWEVDGVAVNPKDIGISFPMPTIKDGTVTVPIGGVQTDVTTGETVGDLPANPPIDWDNQPTDKINWEPLKLTGTLFTQKFPFSIPWDIAAQFSVFDIAPKPPVLKVDRSIPLFGTSMRLKFDIDFTIWDPVFVVVRWGLIVAFDLGMILSIRRFMPE